ncbi:hypothetical protein CK203_068477 [Vitis vinifera]|uniref:Uncharacterized protein n=1 Tax=Vitis vinifera TaxID=29760 RepID=A0A438F2Z1_VITVI|nr:hypothetical protein CK203_068477 [Vitis vinifera]
MPPPVLPSSIFKNLCIAGIVNDQFCQIQALKSEEQPDAVVRDLPDVDFSKLAVEICKIEEKSLQIGAEHMKIACANLILACDQSTRISTEVFLSC